MIGPQLGGWLACFTGQPGDRVWRTSAARQALAVADIPPGQPSSSPLILEIKK